MQLLPGNKDLPFDLKGVCVVIFGGLTLQGEPGGQMQSQRQAVKTVLEMICTPSVHR